MALEPKKSFGKMKWRKFAFKVKYTPKKGYKEQNTLITGITTAKRGIKRKRKEYFGIFRC